MRGIQTGWIEVYTSAKVIQLNEWGCRDGYTYICYVLWFYKYRLVAAHAIDIRESVDSVCRDENNCTIQMTILCRVAPLVNDT